jgi:hypothetical protein
MDLETQNQSSRTYEMVGPNRSYALNLAHNILQKRARICPQPMKATHANRASLKTQPSSHEKQTRLANDTTVHIRLSTRNISEQQMLVQEGL